MCPGNRSYFLCCLFEPRLDWVLILRSFVLCVVCVCVCACNIRAMTEGTQIVVVHYQHSLQGMGLKSTWRFAHSFHFIIKLCFPIKSISAHSEYKHNCVGRKCKFIPHCCSKYARKMTSAQHKAGMQSSVQGWCLLLINLSSLSILQLVKHI